MAAGTVRGAPCVPGGDAARRSGTSSSGVRLPRCRAVREDGRSIGVSAPSIRVAAAPLGASCHRRATRGQGPAAPRPTSMTIAPDACRHSRQIGASADNLSFLRSTLVASGVISAPQPTTICPRRHGCRPVRHRGLSDCARCSSLSTRSASAATSRRSSCVSSERSRRSRSSIRMSAISRVT